MKTLTINHVTRIEGHAKITIRLGDDGKVVNTQLHVTQVRGFEKFTEGRPYYEMPSITARICGICPVSHLLASAKACDAIMAVRIPPAAAMLRELIHCAQFAQSHALSFFHLSAPDLLLGFDSDAAKRNVLGLASKHPELARDGIALRKFGQSIIEMLAKERIHPSWIVPGGVNKPLDPEHRDQILTELPQAKAMARRAIDFYKSVLDRFPEESDYFGNMRSMFAGLTDAAGNLQLYEGDIRFMDADGTIVKDGVAAASYADWIAETTVKDSYLKAPYYKPAGVADGMYRVGPLGRMNVVTACGTPKADAELAEFRQRFGPVVSSSFHYHYARLIELLYSLERIRMLLEDGRILENHVRAKAAVNSLEGVGMIEAPRGILIHHYRVNEEGGIVWANLIVATGHNNLAMSKSVEQVAKHFVDGNKLQEGMLNRVSAVVRAYDPCLSCSTHAAGVPAMTIELVAPDGSVLDELRSE